MRVPNHVVQRALSYGKTIWSRISAVPDAELRSPKVLEPCRRQFGVANRMLNVAVSEVSLQRPRVVTSVRERVAAGVLEHMRVSFEAKPRLNARPVRC
jgi:hypothetical protein